MNRRILAAVILIAVGIMCCIQSCDNNTSEPGQETLGSFDITAPDTVTTGVTFSISVIAVGNQGTRPFTSFSGDVELTLSDGLIFPGSIALIDGEGTIDVVMSGNGGQQTLTARGGGKSGSITLNASLLDAIPGNPGDPVEGAIPEIYFAASDDYYSTGHPDLSGAYISHEIVIVVFEIGTTVGEANAVISRHGASIVGGLTGVDGQAPGIMFLKLPTGTHTEMESALEDMHGDSHVRIAVQDMLVGTEEIPGTNVGNEIEWAWDGTPTGGNWGLELCRVPQMWNLNAAVKKTGQAVMTGIIDAGFEELHEDLVYYNLTPDKEHYHGTMVAGIIGATYNNGKGIDGINPFAGMIVKAIEETSGSVVITYRASAGQAYISNLYTLAKTYNQIKVINISLAYNWYLFDIDGTNDPAAQGLAYMHGALLEQTLNLLSFFRPLPVITAPAGNESNHGFGVQDARYSSPMTNAALEHGVETIIVVEAVDYQQGTGSGDAVLASFSGINGHISAPGVNIQSLDLDNNCKIASGTSFAAPFVAGVISYLLCLDPNLTIQNIQDLLFLNALDVGGGGSDRIDAWASAMDIDRVRANTAILRMLCDIDDGTTDGNLRVDYESGVDFTEEDADGDGGWGDGSVDMSDFRRWRDWLLQVEEAWRLSLDGATDHIKRDVNGDGAVGSAAEENIYPRGDFNGDGVLSSTAVCYVPGAIDNIVTDLEVFQSVFDDAHYSAGDLPGLIESVDITFNCSTAFSTGSGPIEIEITGRYYEVLETRSFGASDPVQIFSVPRDQSDVKCWLNQDGWTVPYNEFEYLEDVARDHYMRPLMVADISPRAGFLHTCGETPLSPAIIALSDLDLNPGDWLYLRVLGSFLGPIGYYGALASGIFSSSDVLLDSSNLHRVPGAIQADTYDHHTTTTYECDGEPTDIPEDFRIDTSLIVEIPAGATHLFIGVSDCWYSDNVEGPDGYAVYLTALAKNGQ
jgi:subtilisin family serine protease